MSIGNSVGRPTLSAVARLLVDYMRSANLTQRQFAEECGVSETAISHVLAKRRAIGPGMATSIETATREIRRRTGIAALRAVELSPTLWDQAQRLARRKLQRKAA